MNNQPIDELKDEDQDSTLIFQRTTSMSTDGSQNQAKYTDATGSELENEKTRKKRTQGAKDEQDIALDPELQKKIKERKTNPLVRFFTRSKVRPIVPNDKPYPYLTANVFSNATFYWIGDFINLGYSRRIENEDLYRLEGTSLSVEAMTEKFEKILQDTSAKFYEKHPGEYYGNVLIFEAISKTFFKDLWIIGGISKVLADATQMTMPLLVRALVKYINEKDLKNEKNVGKAIGFPVGIALMLITASLLISSFFHSTMLSGAQTKGLLTNIIYKKAFRLSTKARIQYPNSAINMMAMTDLSRIDFAVGTFHFIWAFPISFTIAIIILAINLGAPCVVGVATVLIYVLCVMWCNRKLKSLRRQSNTFIGKRVHAITEIINNLRMIKFYSWETPYKEAVQSYRGAEKFYVLYMQILKAVLNAGTSTVTIIGTMFVFLWLHYDAKTRSQFTSYNIFSAITLFNLLRMPLNLLPLAITFSSDASIALEKVALFLQAEEAEETLKRLPYNDSENAIEIANSTFEWDAAESEDAIASKLPLTKKGMKRAAKAAKQAAKKAAKAAKKNSDGIPVAAAAAEHEKDEDFDDEDLTFPGLKSIDLTIKRKELVIITGSIGTGKSSLLSAIDGSMKQVHGDSKVYGSLTFCSYPWVQNATIRDNVLFGCEYDEAKYRSIVEACALDVDFKNLPEGDQTEVGERGITLSGGQKARINLARAVYADRDIILLDDVLSAVDARVGKHIMQECINGILKDKTRLLATHQLSLIDSADRVIILDGSGSIDIGTAQELLARSQAFTNLMEYSKTTTSDDESETSEEKELEERELGELERQKSQISRIQTKKGEEEEKEEIVDKSESRNFQIGTLTLYIHYLLLGSGKLGYAMIPLFLLSVALAGFIQVFSSVWLTYWLEDKFKFSNGSYTAIYVVLCVSSFFVFLILYSLLAYVNNSAGLNLFNNSTARLLKSPMWLMDITPIGRILNRFTKDVDVIDTNLIEQLRLLITTIALVVATVILAGCYIPWFLLVIPFAIFFYWFFYAYYIPSAIDVKTLESTNRSFVFSHFNESLTGMKVVKSYSSTDRFLRRFEFLINQMNSAYYITLSNQRWLSTRMDCISAMLTLFLSLLCSFGVFNITSSASGLLVSYIVQVSSTMSLLLRSMTQVQNDMNSVERLYEYAVALPQEAQHESTKIKPSEEWPQSGALEFEDVSLAYRQGLPLVLKNVSFSVGAGEKIGICGRTGAGKSTIMNALFRISELSNGKVTIDGLDISKLGLNDLRSKLSIIPQDPVLFNGTIRKNLDPFGKSTDAELWDALKRAWLVEDGSTGVGEFAEGGNLKSFHKFHLDQLVEDDGSNFSLGERQLLALARALVRNSKILILDEATSSVDYETDAKIQSTIVTEFASCTILCIAHRLKTILNYDKILVLDKGEVREFDTPYNLFKLGGIFSEMCERSKITGQDFENLH